MFTATFVRFGETKTVGGKRIEYMLIQDVRDSRDRLIDDHVWMPLRTKDYVPVALFTGDVIRFEALVNRYMKGSLRRRHVDYGLVKPKDVELVEIEIEQEA